MSGIPERCPMCQCGRLVCGTMIGKSQGFIPGRRSFMWFPFVAKEGFVCLGCGYMGHYLDERDLERLRSEEARPKRPLDEL